MLSSGVLSVAQYPLLEALLSTAWAHVLCHVRYGTPFLRRPPTVDLSSFPLGSGLAFVFLFQGYTAVPGQCLFRVVLAFLLSFPADHGRALVLPRGFRLPARAGLIILCHLALADVTCVA